MVDRRVHRSSQQIGGESVHAEDRRGDRGSTGTRLDQVRAEFVRWQDELDKRLHAADGLDLRRAKAVWPIRPFKWSLGSFILIMIAHERRHTFQARHVRQNPAFPA
jgi:hypothetical protein